MRRWWYHWVFWGGLILAVLAWDVSRAGAAGETTTQARATIESTPPWTIQADEITVEPDRQIYRAKGRVRLSRGQEVIEGDQARYHAANKMAEIRGQVVLTTADFKATCRRVVVNLDQNIGKIYDGKVFFPANHYYVAGDEIERTGPDTFLLLQGRATSCDGPSPAWSLNGRNIVIEREGYATAEHATFTTRYFPILYLPWLKVPVKAQRQSGLLMPGISNSSRDGFTWTQPFFWALSDSHDMTLYLTYMADRGLETTIEAAYNDWGGKGAYRLSYLKDNAPPTVSYSNDPRTETRGDRYWLRGMSDMKTEGGLILKANVDYASDSKYLDEFSGSVTGFNSSRQLFLNEFGRELGEQLDPLRRTTLQATKDVNSQHFKFALEYTQNLKSWDNLETIQRLPRIGLDVTRLDLPDTPFYFSSSSEYNLFTRRTNTESARKEEGHRLDIHPQFHWPIKFSRYLDLEPTVGLRETLYFPHGMNAGPDYPLAEDKNYRFYRRELYDLGLSASTNLSRVYDFSLGPVDKFKHRVKPEVSFQLIPGRVQGELPFWDSVDRVRERKEIRYGLMNYLVGKTRKETDQSRTPNQTAKRTEEDYWLDEGRAPEYEYNEYLRLGLHQVYDFITDDQAVLGRTPDLPSLIRRTHSPWEIDLAFDLGPYLRGQAISQFDTQYNIFTDHAALIETSDQRGDSLSLEYELHVEPYFPSTQRRAEYEEIRGNMRVALDDEWSVGYQRRHSLMYDRDLEVDYILSYQPQCWGARLVYSERPDDKSIAIYFSLLGLGEIGGYSQRTASRTQNPVKQVETTP